MLNTTAVFEGPGEVALGAGLGPQVGCVRRIGQAVINGLVNEPFDGLLDRAEIEHHALLVQIARKFYVYDPALTDQSATGVKEGEVDHSQIFDKKSIHARLYSGLKILRILSNTAGEAYSSCSDAARFRRYCPDGGSVISLPRCQILPEVEQSVPEHRDTRSPLPVIILAAGQGSRLGQCKPLARLGGSSLLEQSILGLKPLTGQLVVVLGAQWLRVRLRSRAQPHRWRVNMEWQKGQSTSLQAGLSALSGTARGALVCLVDQPAVPVHHYAQLLHRAAEFPAAVVATEANGRLMVPAYLPRELWGDVFRLRGDQGARSILSRLGKPLVVQCEAAAHDVDTAADLAWHRLRWRPSE